MKFFHGCTSKEEAKAIYHKLAKCFHPDKGGSTELMVELQKQYESWDEPVFAQAQTFTPNGFRSTTFNFNQINGLRESFEVQGLKKQIRDLETQVRQQKEVINDERVTNGRVRKALEESNEMRVKALAELHEAKLDVDALCEEGDEMEEKIKMLEAEVCRLTKIKAEPKKTILQTLKDIVSS